MWLRAFVSQITKYYLGAGVVAFLIFLVFLLKWWLYKRALRKDPNVAAAVNDEMVKQNWLMAFRKAFIVMISLGIVLELLKIVTNFSFFWHWRSPWTTLINVLNFWHLQIVIYAGVMTCLASFLHYYRETENE